MYTSGKCFLFGLIAIILPPLPILIMRKFKKEFWISLVLCLLFWVPGIIYAEYYICNHFRTYAITHFDF
ncbi:hypothetical protein EHI8A_046820 [Entamoeba histolytica HM-1:IMSS-B]|uniref:YqaE/Pmp3 family membrane protein n=6 Tax=Entamoeba histolytica TaxID=5759 RepID=B1N379_ENTH1|nr:hypothetical protein EHI_005110 [Entamoeba histolytica HM-1:IMSS]EMD46999.1 Hypothetical protein EHI5A_039650 [Entamoeba histolytica KU27]EMH72032.1 hypothetical protein EHI8A_046820 [Entamoeba histolytica HM-1:IMSS-B]EMS13475.1 hypothetical protein KM1_094200 [Entamoeba histolytica HM-3:IMSS]ENY62418.1 hypothetical protein EHI7A_047710 [Entamoeba histolytica HM-1:IMSS-A]GAT94581.1 hypothetical protein CL6EHI_005110 [Entamoeba histolytica]|eukprot:XP_001913645.1 hypothetical protein EHI_005110 [Entamoeba histolytica HM-1:IMSS]